MREPAEYPVEELLGPLNQVERKNAPERLFAAGDVGLLRAAPRVAIVGARRASDAGLRRARKLAAELARAGVVVVSGLAEGIDTAAHEGTLAAGGRTVAVLGTPLDRVYPRQNHDLQRQIAEDHLLLSQFAPGAPVLKRNFPIRNRLMALASDATVIVEASDSSGALSQGWEALRLGRLVFIMKSILDVPDLVWPGRMVHYGAQVLAATGSLTRQLPVAVGADVAAAVDAF